MRRIRVFAERIIKTMEKYILHSLGFFVSLAKKLIKKMFDKILEFLEIDVLVG